VGNVSAVHRGSACYSACCPLSSRNADRAAQFHVRAGHPSLGMPPRKMPSPQQRNHQRSGRLGAGTAGARAWEKEMELGEVKIGG
jgi:hypothetical protein